MDSEQKKRVKTEIKFEYYLDRHKEFINYLCFIQKQVSNGNKIPARVLKKVSDILSEPHSEFDIRKSFIINETFNRFNNKTYNFNYNRRLKTISLGDIPLEELVQEIEQESTKRSYFNIKVNLKTIITHTINETYIKYANNTIVPKDDCIINIFDCVEKYCKDNLNKKNYDFLTLYKKQTIVGFITTQYGFHLTEDRNPNNYQLFQATRNAIKKRGKNV
ncbi:MAG: hypothetical protein AB7O47_09160 [Flavobacteriales bacterium]